MGCGSSKSTAAAGAANVSPDATPSKPTKEPETKRPDEATERPTTKVSSKSTGNKEESGALEGKSLSSGAKSGMSKQSSVTGAAGASLKGPNDGRQGSKAHIDNDRGKEHTGTENRDSGLQRNASHETSNRPLREANDARAAQRRMQQARYDSLTHSELHEMSMAHVAHVERHADVEAELGIVKLNRRKSSQPADFHRIELIKGHQDEPHFQHDFRVLSATRKSFANMNNSSSYAAASAPAHRITSTDWGDLAGPAVHRTASRISVDRDHDHDHVVVVHTRNTISDQHVRDRLSDHHHEAEHLDRENLHRRKPRYVTNSMGDDSL